MTFLRSTRMIITEALNLYQEGGTLEGIGKLLKEYERIRAEGAFVPGVEVNGDELKELLVDLVNTKESLAKAPVHYP